MKKLTLTNIPLLLFILLLLFALPCYGFDIGVLNCDDSDDTTWCIISSDASFDGSSDCGGACDSGDTIYIQGGTRSNLQIKNFNGSGSYIPIINDPDDRVIINNDGSGSQSYVFNIHECQYIDLRGNNNPSYTYGILVENDGGSNTPSSTVKISGKTSFAKIGYIEIDWPTGAAGTGSSGYHVSDNQLTMSTTHDSLELHHSFIHDSRYAGMYLGNNDPLTFNSCQKAVTYTASTDIATINPYHGFLDNELVRVIDWGTVPTGLTPNEVYYTIFISDTEIQFTDEIDGSPINFTTDSTGYVSHGCSVVANMLVHDNIIEDSGAYGFNIKGLSESSTLTKVYNNKIRSSNRVSGDSTGLLYKYNSGTAQNGSSSTLTLASGASGTSSLYVNERLYLLTGTGSTQDRIITAYNGSTKVATVSPNWDSPYPTTGTTYEIKGTATQGISFSTTEDTPIEVYSNWIEKTYGMGINVGKGDSVTGKGHAGLEIFNNLFLGCGVADTDSFGTAVSYTCGASDAKSYNNTIIKPLRYGIALVENCGEASGYHYDNLIVAPGVDYDYDPDATGNLVETYANTETATDPGFASYDGDDNYSNDNFDLAAGHSVGTMGDQVLTTDYNGDARAVPFDDGAYDYDSAGCAGIIGQTDLDGYTGPMYVNGNSYGQSFVANLSITAGSVNVTYYSGGQVIAEGTPTGNDYIRIDDDLDMTSEYICQSSAFEIGAMVGPRSETLTGCTLVDGQTYYLGIVQSAGDADNYVSLGQYRAIDNYAGGAKLIGPGTWVFSMPGKFLISSGLLSISSGSLSILGSGVSEDLYFGVEICPP